MTDLLEHAKSRLVWVKSPLTLTVDNSDLVQLSKRNKANTKHDCFKNQTHVSEADFVHPLSVSFLATPH